MTKRVTIFIVAAIFIGILTVLIINISGGIVAEKEVISYVVPDEIILSEIEDDEIVVDEITNELEHQDINCYFLSWMGSDWGECGPVFGDYYLAFVNKLLYSKENWDIDEVEFTKEEIELLEATKDSSNTYVKFVFNNSMDTLLKGIPRDVYELILVPKEEDGSHIYLKTGDVWHSYVVIDTELSFDFQILSTIMRLEYEYEIERYDN